MSNPAGLSITAVILTKDEEDNLPKCLGSLRDWCRPIFVVDSGSADRTLEIAHAYGAQAVFHSFRTHAYQWNWALSHLPIRTEWVLTLDADQRVSPGLREEILRALPTASKQIGGYYLPRKQVFRGRWIRYGGYWPKYLLKLFRKGAGRCDEAELLDFRFYVKGKTALLRCPLIEENLKERQILFWLQKHLHFVELRAQEEFRRRREGIRWEIRPSLWGTPDQRTLRLKTWWYGLPPLVRPFPYFLFRYVIQMGFLDGWRGFLFHFLHSFWYELMIGVRLKEIQAEVLHGDKSC